MKNLFLSLITIILSSLCLYAQENKEEGNANPSLEIMLSVNRTTGMDENSHGRFGFGAGVHYAFFSQKRCNLIMGLEYNRNDLFVDYINTNGKWGGGNYNSTYSINNISIPVCFRVNMGQKIKFFVEGGAFVDFAVSGKAKGTYVSYNPNPADSTITKVEKSFDDKFSYKSPNFGLQGGIGLRIPVKKHEILLKGDYKWGIRNLIDDYNGAIHNSCWRFSVGFKANL